MKYRSDINNIHDKSYKDLLSSKDIFEGLIKSFVNKSWCKEINKEDLELVNKSFVLSDYEEMESDILYKAKIGEEEVLFYILLEMQSTPDYSMPIRLYLYMAEIWREHLKGFTKSEVKRKDFKLPAIIPIVLYNGEFLWTADKSFRKKISKEELFGDNIVDFSYILLDVNRYDKEELMELGNAASAIFLLDQYTEPFEFIERIKEIALNFHNLTEDDKRRLSKWLRVTLSDGFKENIKDDEDILLTSREGFESMTANFVKAMEKTLLEKKVEGIEEGREEGREEGDTNRIKIGVRNMVENNMDNKTIAGLLGIDISLVEKFVKEIKDINK